MWKAKAVVGLTTALKRAANAAASENCPPDRAIAGADVWLTGQRAANSPPHARNCRFCRIWCRARIDKYNPIFDWSNTTRKYTTAKQCVATICTEGFPSIGCDRTRPVSLLKTPAPAVVVEDKTAKNAGCTNNSYDQTEEIRNIVWRKNRTEQRPTRLVESESIHYYPRSGGRMQKSMPCSFLKARKKIPWTCSPSPAKRFPLGSRKEINCRFPLVHIDTGHNHPEVIAPPRRAQAAKLNARLIVGRVEDSIAKGTVVLRKETDSRRNAAQAVTLLKPSRQNGYDALMDGARRDGERKKTPPKNGFSRSATSSDNGILKAQRPELWSPYNNSAAQRRKHARLPDFQLDGTRHPRQYIARENLWAAADLALQPQARSGQTQGAAGPSQRRSPRKCRPKTSEILLMSAFRTVGDTSAAPHLPVESAHRVHMQSEIIRETAVADISELQRDRGWTIRQAEDVQWKTQKGSAISHQNPLSRYEEENMTAQHQALLRFITA